MSLAPIYALEARQGDTFRLNLEYKDEDSNPIDLTGCLVEFGLAPAPGGKPIFQYFSPEFVTVDGPAGELTIEVPSEDTKRWSQRRLHYEVTLTFTDDSVLTLLEGRLSIRPEIVA